jgi:hypothetical protein
MIMRVDPKKVSFEADWKNWNFDFQMERSIQENLEQVADIVVSEILNSFDCVIEEDTCGTGDFSVSISSEVGNHMYVYFGLSDLLDNAVFRLICEHDRGGEKHAADIKSGMKHFRAILQEAINKSLHAEADPQGFLSGIDW